eukprot:gene18693-13463_t
MESKLIAFLQPQSAQETILIDFLNDDDDAMPGQLKNGRKLCHLIYEPDFLIPINTKFGQEEHVFLLEVAFINSGDATATEMGENESEVSGEQKEIKPKVAYTGVYSKARCRWIYATHHVIFRNIVREARERKDIMSMSRKSPEKILVMERKRQEAQQMLAALQREAAAQEAVKHGSRRTVVDGIREAANNLSK